MTLAPRYLDKPEQWTKLAAAIKGKTVGWDTEYYREDGTDARKGSARGCKVHVWSLALPTAELSPRGFLRCQSVVLPGEALCWPELQLALMDASTTLIAHNGGVDVHAAENTAPGLRIDRIVNTLEYARWVWPDLVNGTGFGLKSLMVTRLGRKPVGGFDDLFTEPDIVEKERTVKSKTCSCGIPGCRKRKGHEKTEQITVEKYLFTKKEPKRVPLPVIVSGHRLWDTLVRYAGEDAECALELHQLLTKPIKPRSLPW